MPERHTKFALDIVNLEGLVTKTNPDLLQVSQLNVCQNVDFTKEYGSVRKITGNRKVLANSIGASTPVSWIGFYKGQNFAGQVVKETLIQAGTSIYKTVGAIGSATVTSLAAGEPNGMYRSHAQFDRFMLITGQNPRLTGEAGGFYKFDGYELSTWGLTAPGEEETSIEPFNNASNFATNQCTVANESNIGWRGVSMKLTKDSGPNSCYAERLNMTPFAVNNVIEDRARMRVFISQTTGKKLATSGRTFSVYFSCTNGFTALDDWVRYDFQIGNLLKGWNTLYFDHTIFPAGTLGQTNLGSGAPDFDDQNMDAMRYEWIFNSAYSADEIVVYMDELVSLDAGTPITTLTGLTGNAIFPGGSTKKWNYVVTYVDDYGYESNRGTISVDADNTDTSSSVLWTYDAYPAANLTLTNTNNETTDGSDVTEGDASISFGHPSGNTTASVKVADQSWDMSGADGNQFSVDIKIAVGIRTKLATDGIRVQAGNSALSNYWEWRFDRDDIDEGAWTTLTCDFDTPDIQVGAPLQSDVDNITVQYVFKDTTQTAAGTELKIDNLVMNLVSDYDSIVLSEIPTSSNPSVVKRNIYRTVANGTSYFYLDTLYDNTTVNYTDTTPDSALGTQQPPQVGQFFDSSPPPYAGIVQVWKRTVFMAGDPRDPNLLYFSQDDNPNAFPIINGFDLDSPITGMFETRQGLIVTTETDLWRVIGDNPDYYVDKVLKGMGNVGWRACGESKLYGWAHDTDGIRLYDLVETNKFSEVIRDKLEAINRTNLYDTWSIHSAGTNQMIFAYKNVSGTYVTYYIYQYAVDDVRQGWWWEMILPSGLEFLCAEEFEDSAGEPRLYVGGNDGMLYELMTGGNNSWVNAAGTESAITMRLRTIFIRAGMAAGEADGATGRWIPTLLELRARESSGAAHEWTVLIETSDGSGPDHTVRASQTLTFSFPAGVTLQRYRPKDLVAGEYVRFDIQNSQLNKDVYLMGMRVYVDARPGQFVVHNSTPGGRS